MTFQNPYLGQKVGVLMGGLSSERRVSLASGSKVLEALARRGHQVHAVDVGRDLVTVLQARGIEVCYNALHGTYGEDGCVQGVLELLGIPYTGSGPLASALAMDKVRSKLLFTQVGLPTPRFEVVRDVAVGAGLDSPFGYPVVVKPTKEGSSVGVTIVQARDELERAVVVAASHGDGTVMIEEYVEGAEVTVGLLDGRALGSTEIVPADPFYDFHAKYDSDATRYYTPARLPQPTLERIHELAEQAVEVLGARGAPRVDFIVDGAGRAWILEVNTSPGMTDHSLLPMCATLAGIGYDELCDRILASATLDVGGDTWAG